MGKYRAIVTAACIAVVVFVGIEAQQHLQNRSSPDPSPDSSVASEPVAQADAPGAAAKQTTPTPTQTPIPSEGGAGEGQSSTSEAENAPAPTQPPPAPANCYDEDSFARGLHKTAATRSEFADESADTLRPLGIFVTAGGNDNRYLLFTSSPEDQPALIKWEATLLSDPEDRARLCLEGFGEVQFIIRDKNMRQRLAGKYPTNWAESYLYLQQHMVPNPFNEMRDRICAG